MIQANHIAVRILQISLAPEPDLVFRRLVEFDAELAQPLIGGIQIIAFEIDHGLRRQHRVERMQRKGRTVLAFESRIARRRADHLRESQAPIEFGRALYVGGRQCHLIQVHGADYQASRALVREIDGRVAEKEATMKREVPLIAVGLGGILLCMSGTRLGLADDAAPKIQFFPAAQLEALVAHPAEGVAAKQFLNGPGSNVYMIYRDRNGETEVHMALNDIFVVKSGHAKITIGGQVTGNRETAPTEWRGGEITGGTD